MRPLIPVWHPLCSYCQSAAIWWTERDNHWYCPAHLYCASMKQLAWEAAA